jgi:superfamily II DNA/RNA helicase
LVPTRELAHQVQESLEYLFQVQPQKSVVVIGGESEEAQLRGAKGAQWLIATPGRLLDLVQRRLLDLSYVQTLVFDEADRILDMGFIDDVRALLKFMPKPAPQMLFFSATLHFGIEELAYEFGVNFQKIGVATDELTVEGLDHQVVFIGDEEKYRLLCFFLHERKGKRGIVFSNYRDRAHELSYSLRKLGAPVEGLSAQLNQSQRSRIMEEFRQGKVEVLVASDLAARGLDVQDLDFVVNFDLPEDPATYVHRVGRTARAGKSGLALSFVGFNDSFRLEGLEKFLAKKINRFDFDPEILKAPIARWGAAQSASLPGSESQGRKEGFAQRKKSNRFDAPREARKPRPAAQIKPQYSPPRKALPSKGPGIKSATVRTQPRTGLATKILDSILGVFGLERVKPSQKR